MVATRVFFRWRLQVGRKEGRQDREQDQRDRDGDEEQQPPGEPRVELDARVGRGRTVAGHRGRAAGARGRMVGRRARSRRGRARVAARARRRLAAGRGAAAVGLRGPVNVRPGAEVVRTGSPPPPSLTTVRRAQVSEDRFAEPSSVHSSGAPGAHTRREPSRFPSIPPSFRLKWPSTRDTTTTRKRLR